MIFVTAQECDRWIDGRALQRPDREKLENLVAYPKEAYRYHGFAQTIAEKLFIDDEVLLTLVEWSIWSSNENLHLYYRLRHSYHDYRAFYEAPGHLFMKHEKEDMVSFLQVAMMNGWGGYIISQSCGVGFFFSHDDFIALYGKNQQEILEFQKAMEACSR